MKVIALAVIAFVAAAPLIEPIPEIPWSTGPTMAVETLDGQITIDWKAVEAVAADDTRDRFETWRSVARVMLSIRDKTYKEPPR